MLRLIRDIITAIAGFLLVSWLVTLAISLINVILGGM